MVDSSGISIDASASQQKGYQDAASSSSSVAKEVGNRMATSCRTKSDRRKLFRKMKASSWHGQRSRKGIEKDCKRSRKSNGQNSCPSINDELLTLETLLEEYKKEHEKNKEEIHELQNEKIMLASQLADLSEKYNKAVDEKWRLRNQLQASNLVVERMKRQMQRSDVSSRRHHASHARSASRITSARSVSRGNSCIATSTSRQLVLAGQSGLLQDYKEQFLPTVPQGQGYIPTAEAVALPKAIPILEEEDSNTKRHRGEKIPERRLRSAGWEGRDLSRSRLHTSCSSRPRSLEDYFQEMSLDRHISQNSSSVISSGLSATSRNDASRCFVGSDSSAFSRYTAV